MRKSLARFRDIAQKRIFTSAGKLLKLFARAGRAADMQFSRRAVATTSVGAIAEVELIGDWFVAGHGFDGVRNGIASLQLGRAGDRPEARGDRHASKSLLNRDQLVGTEVISAKQGDSRRFACQKGRGQCASMEHCRTDPTIGAAFGVARRRNRR